MRAIATVGALTACASADIVPVQGTQHMTGRTTANLPYQPSIVQSFDISAPDPLASWEPPPQSVMAAVAGASALVQATYSSSIGPGGVVLSTTAEMTTVGSTGSSMASAEYLHDFSLRFTIDAPGTYVLVGSITRFNHTGWWATPSTISFGLEGEQPLLTLTHLGPTIPFPYRIGTPPATIALQAGTYVVTAHDSHDFGGWRWFQMESAMLFSLTAGCYANCDGSTTPPILTVNDFACFLNRFAAGDSRADCDGSSSEPGLTVADFACFLNQFAAGCP